MILAIVLRVATCFPTEIHEHGCIVELHSFRKAQVRLLSPTETIVIFLGYLQVSDTVQQVKEVLGTCVVIMVLLCFWFLDEVHSVHFIEDDVLIEFRVNIQATV